MKELESPTERLSHYEKLEKLGEGAFGKVYKVKDKITQKIVAMKQIIEAEDSFGGISTTTLREASILSELHHPNIIKILDLIYISHESSLKIFLIFPYVKTDLRRYMEENKGKINLFQIKSIMYQILSGINYLHQNRIFHRDIKPCNILLEENGLIKLADFGLARYFSMTSSEYTIPIQTLHYRAPEVCLGSSFYGPPVDIWGAGCVFAELMESIVLFSGDSEIDEIFKIFNLFGTPGKESSLFKYPSFNGEFPKFECKDPRSYLKNFDDVSVDLFKRMMKLEPEKRISAKNALNHEFFDGLDFSHLYNNLVM